MIDFTYDQKKVDELIREYKKRGESVRISETLKCNSKLYIEALFFKRVITGRGRDIKGSIFISLEDMKIVKSQQLINQLSNIAYYYDLFCDKDSPLNISKAIQSEETIERDNRDFLDVIKALDYLYSKGVDYTLGIKEIMQKLPKLRGDSNEKLKELKKSIEEETTISPLSEENIKRLIPTHQQAMVLNFKKIKLINSHSVYYDELKKVSEKTRKKISVRFNKGLTTPIFKLSYEMDYFRRLIRTYEVVLKMTEKQYLKFLQDNEKKNIQERIQLNRA